MVMVADLHTKHRHTRPRRQLPQRPQRGAELSRGHAGCSALRRRQQVAERRKKLVGCQASNKSGTRHKWVVALLLLLLLLRSPALLLHQPRQRPCSVCDIRAVPTGQEGLPQRHLLLLLLQSQALLPLRQRQWRVAPRPQPFVRCLSTSAPCRGLSVRIAMMQAHPGVPASGRRVRSGSGSGSSGSEAARPEAGVATTCSGSNLPKRHVTTSSLARCHISSGSSTAFKRQQPLHEAP